METVIKRHYEAMFLLDSALAASDWEGINDHIKAIFDKLDADIISMKKWDERRLSYEIKGVTRGTYILVYFEADPSTISELERQVKLSERIMRMLVLKADHLTEEDMKKETPATAAEKEQEEKQEEAEEASEKQEEKEETAETGEEAEEAAEKIKQESAEEKAEASSEEQESVEKEEESSQEDKESEENKEESEEEASEEDKQQQ